jgi:RNA polymerase sigma-70 factor (ECF subfamily)
MDDDIRKRLEARQFAEAFGLLVERFQDKVFRLAFSMLRNETQAEDVAQDVFVRIWKGLPSYHGGASLSTWVYTITRNTCLTELKKRSARPTVSLSDPCIQATADDMLVSDNTPNLPGAELDLPAALAELPDRYRQVVTLFYLEQRAYEEVATMLGIPLGTVKTLLFRAKKELLRIGSRQISIRKSAAPSRLDSVSRTKSLPTRAGVRCAMPKTSLS